MMVAACPIEVKELTIRYGRTLALDRVSLSVDSGRVFALLGRNGAGKSSLVRCLLGQQRPEGGGVRLFGADAWSTRAAAMARTGVVFEDPQVPSAMTAREANAFFARFYPVWGGCQVLERLRRFQVPLEVPSGELSRGQKAQLALALALGFNPELLVLDDPTLGLDAVARRAFYQELVGDLADRETTVFITTHDLAGVEGLADFVGILREGRLLVQESVESLKGRFRSIRTSAEFAGSETGRETLKALGVIRVTAQPWGVEALVARFDECYLPALSGEATIGPLSLEEIFIALDGGVTEVEA
jgi:ABC-2 type transport system ATP-binding protein